MQAQFKLPPYITLRARREKVTAIYKRAGFPQRVIKAPLVVVNGAHYASAEFIAEYASIVNGTEVSPAVDPAKPMDEINGSLAWLCSRYYRSDAHKLMMRPGRIQRRNLLDKICQSKGAEDGEPRGRKAYATMTRANVLTLRDDTEGTTTTKNNAVKALRIVFNWAIDAELATFNPVAKIKPLADANPDGFYTWTADDAAKFIACHPLGTTARLAFTLMRYTAMRQSDVKRVGPAMLHETPEGLVLRFQEYKGSESVLKPTHKHREFPVRDELLAAIRAMPVATLNGPYLRNNSGGEFSSETLNNYIRGWCAEAGCSPRCTSHGIRKHVATKLADDDASVYTISALLGHSTTKLAEKYTAKRDRAKLTNRAVAAI